MASKNPKKKKKCKCQPYLSKSFLEAGACPTEPIIHDELDEETLKLLSHCEQYFAHNGSKKKRRKNNKEIQTKREKSKQRKLKWKRMETEIKDLSELCIEKENLDSCQEKADLQRILLENYLSFRNNKKVKKNKIQIHNAPNSSYKKKHKKKNPCKNSPVSLTSIYSPAAGKKEKWEKQSHNSINLCVSKSKFSDIKHEKSWTSPEPVQKGRSQMKQQRLYKYLCCYPSQNSSFVEEIKQNIDVCCEDVSTFKAICPAEAFESAFQSSDTGNLETLSTPHKAVPVCESVVENGCKLKACPYNPEPSLSPNVATPEIKPGDMKGELCVEDVKHTKSSCSSADLSQDLFITQKLFRPVQISSTDSCSSSLQSDTKEMNVEEAHHTSTDRMEWFSQAASKKLKYFEQCHTAVNKLSSTGRKKRRCTTEKATQTDDFLSSPILASSFSHAKRFTSCSVQPLDLSLPFRVRSGISCPKQVSCSVSGESEDIHLIPKPMQDLIHCMEEQFPNAKTLSIVRERNREKCISSQSRKPEEGKYVQMLLNSSYFFKGKGEVGVDTPMAPLLKQKIENEKRLSGESRREKTKLGSTFRQ